MRIISGHYRGRRLRGPRGLQIRPTSDRLRETLFDILGDCVQGSVVLDLFAGTGAVGLEAASRGAREVVFVESSADGIRLIEDNLRICKVATGYRILRRDVFAAIRLLAQERFSADTVFMDPPYHWSRHEQLVARVFRAGLVLEMGRAILEHHRRAQTPESGPGFRRTRLVRQGEKCLSFYQADSSL